jgi:Domain of unknown function (DUF4397)
MNILLRLNAFAVAIILAGAGCSGTGSSSSSGPLPPSGSGNALVRFADGAPFLVTLINGVPTDIGTAYLQVDGRTVASSFTYGTITSFMGLPAGTHMLKALDTLGYFVGPLKSASLSAGKRYTLVVVGAYPNYRVVAFEEPADQSGAQMSLYEASPAAPLESFGSFRASSRSNFSQLGTARFGNVATASLGKSVSNIGGYVGPSNAPIGEVTPARIDSFDSHNVLPFHNAARLSLFLFDVKPGSSAGPVFGSLDK